MLAAGIFLCGIHAANAQSFAHPGMLANDEDFARIRAKISANQEPWTGAWNNLYNSWHSSPTYNIRGPADTIYRGSDGTHAENYQIMYEDAASAYANALRWKISGEEGCAKKAVDILNRYANGLKCIGGSTDALLLTGLQGYQFANAAEIMRTYPGWSAGELKTFQDFMINVFYGLPSNPNYNGLRRFLVAHNGTQDRYYWANWDICAMTAMLSIGILCDNRDIYNEAANYFKAGRGNGNIANLVNFVYDGGLGQWQESGRDQGHTSMGPVLMAIFCEMAWKQGDDLYGFDDNRLLKGAEYVAKFNSGNMVPYTAYDHPKNFSGIETQWGISWDSRGTIRTGWDLLYNHYVVQKGLSAPFTQISALSLRPDGGPNDGNSGEFDLIGYSTLTSYLDPGLKKKNQVINWKDTTMTLGGPDLDLGVKGSSGLPCYYTLSDFSMGEIINNKVHATKAGTLTVTAWQTGDEEYNEAAPVSKWVIIKDSSIAIAPISDGLTIQLQVKSTAMCVDVMNADMRPGTKIDQWACGTGDNQKWTLGLIAPDEYKLVSVHGGLVLDVTNKGNTAGSLVEQDTFANEDHQIWKLLKNADGTIRLINKGNNLALGVLNSDTAQLANFAMAPYTGAASQNFNYIDVSNSIIQYQTISFAPLPKTFPGDTDIKLSATSTSGLPVSFSSTNPSVASVTNGVVHVLKGGTAAIVASQAGTPIFHPALDVAQPLIAKKIQTLDVKSLENLSIGARGILLGAKASSGLAVDVVIFDTSIVKYYPLTDSMIFGKIGTSVITIVQQGNDEYLPVFMEKVLTVNAGSVTIKDKVLAHEGVKVAELDGALFVSNGGDNQAIQDVRIVDMLGKNQDSEKSWNGAGVLVNIRSLSTGVYMLEIKEPKRTSVFRIVRK
jgi:hypothetical protein